MPRLAFRGRLLGLACAGAMGCASAGSGDGSGGSVGIPVSGGGSAGFGGSTTAGNGGNASPSTGGSASSATAPFIAPRIRRLTNAEYDATVQALLGTKLSLAGQFVPDARLYKYGKFDRNDAQIVEPVLARQLQQAAERLAKEYVANKLELALPCVAMGDAACARTFFESFLAKAYRRPITVAELDALLSVVVTPAIARDGFKAAVELGIEAALQATAFLYHTELGTDPAPAARFTLTNAEIADAMAYLLTGAPADAQLAAVSELAVPERRELEARRLLQTPGARLQLRRMVKQWLDIDHVSAVAKDKLKFPDFNGALFDAESNDFIEEVVFNRKGDFRLLLGADFTVGGAELAAFYGAPAPDTDPGIIDLKGLPRTGIMNRGAFLASYATPDLPAPVRRGARFLTQVLCVDPGDPNALMILLTLPPPDAAKTTRQRFEEHSQGTCVGCHGMIDSIGFTFQHFNAIGAWEAAEDGNPDLPIDSATTLRLPLEVPFAGQRVADSSELARLASDSEAGRRCFARNLARFASASYGPQLEQGFIDTWQRLAAGGQDSAEELLVAYVKSEFFVQRDPKGAVSGQ